MKKLQDKKGFTILYAVLIASLLLAIGVGLYANASKALLLSSEASASQVAIFAANSGLECALYWDLKGNGTLFFATSTTGSPEPSGENTASCGFTNIVTGAGIDGGANQSAWVTTLTSTSGTTVFDVLFDNDTCSIVTVTKTAVGSAEATAIDARGYNICAVADPLRVERGLQATYQ